MATPLPAAVPAAPTNLACAAGDTVNTLTWLANASTDFVTSYTLYRGLSSGTETSYQTGITSLFYADQGLTDGTQYFYKLTATNLTGESTKSSEVSGTPTSATILAQPTSLVAVAGNNQVSLTWSAPAGSVLTYTVYRGTASGQETTLAIGITTTAFVDTTAINGTLYFYTVVAVNSFGDGAASSEVSMAPVATAAPQPPTLFTATGGVNECTLTWVAPPGPIDNYILYRGTIPTALAVVHNSVPSTATTYIDTTLTAGTYYYGLIAVYNGLQSTQALTTSSAVTAASAPAAPTGVIIDNTTAGEILLHWTVPSGATSGTVYRGTASGSETRLALTGNGVSNYSDFDVTPGTIYYYYVTGTENGVESTASSEVSASASGVPVPGAPVNLVATTGTFGIGLTWGVGNEGGANTLSYILYRGVVSGGELTALTTIAPNLFGYTDSSVNYGTEYFYRLAAVNPAGTGDLSNETNCIWTVPAQPAKPGSFAATSTSLGNVALTWTAPSSTYSIVYYNLYRGTSSGGEVLLPFQVPAGTSYTDTYQIVAGTTYYYILTAVSFNLNQYFEGVRSAEISVTSFGTPSPVIFGFGLPVAVP